MSPLFINKKKKIKRKQNDGEYKPKLMLRKQESFHPLLIKKWFIAKKESEK